MNEVSLFIIEVVMGLAVSAFVIIVFKKPLKMVLIDICGTEIRANFWVTYTNLMLVIAPLLTSIMFGKSGAAAIANFTFYKTALGSVIFGIFISLLIVGLQIMKAVSQKECEPSILP